MSARVTVVLGRDGMGPESDEADYDAWVSYVADRIDKRSGLDVTVEESNPRDVQIDQYSSDVDGNDEIVAEAISALWEEFCADTSAWPARQVSA